MVKKIAKKKEVVQQYKVFVTQESEEQTYWTRVGTAFQYETGNIVVLLNALPTNGKLTLLPFEEEAENGEEDEIRPRRK